MKKFFFKSIIKSADFFADTVLVKLDKYTPWLSDHIVMPAICIILLAIQFFFPRAFDTLMGDEDIL